MEYIEQSVLASQKLKMNFISKNFIDKDLW